MSRSRAPAEDGGTTTSSRRDEAPGVVIFAAGGARRLALGPGQRIVLGRSSSADVALDDRSLSRRHAALSRDASGGYALEDLGSRNGTRVRGVALEPGVPTRLEPGDHAEIGDALLVVSAERLPSRPSELPAAGPSPSGADAWRSLDRILPLVARGTISVLLLGETGVGKEVTARALHEASPRRGAPFLAIHCAALPEGLLEAELFGFERGAFTGATAQKPGLLESAEGGTVFLDEIGEVPLATQAKLLRVLETRAVARLGSLKPRTIDVRFVSATNRPLDEMVRLGTFRGDLYYRLAGVALQVPSLRARMADVARLARRFADEAALAAKVPARGFTGAALACLEAYAWPGNVRELRNVVECAVLLADGAPLAPEHLPPHVRDGAHVVRASIGAPPASAPSPVPAPASAKTLRAEREALERRRILDALDANGGNQTRAAQALGMGRRTLIDRMAAWNLPRPRKGRP